MAHDHRRWHPHPGGPLCDSSRIRCHWRLTVSSERAQAEVRGSLEMAGSRAYAVWSIHSLADTPARPPSAGRRACSPDCCSPELSVQGRRIDPSRRRGRQRRRHHLPLFDCRLSDGPWRTGTGATRTRATVAECCLQDERLTNASSRRIHAAGALLVQRIYRRGPDLRSSASVWVLISLYGQRMSIE